ncbi:MAG: AI-2E family transporter [Chloroflexi bacterium]|nr:AI-2E family transporter [Chloroflexota bacterium]
MERELRERLINVLLILLIALAGYYIAQLIWQVLSGYADILLLFILGWLVSFVLNPIVFQLSAQPIFFGFEPFLKRTVGEVHTKRLMVFRLSREMAVVIVYLVLVLLVIAAFAVLAPTAITQLTTLGRHLPEYVAQAPEASGWIEAQLARVGIHVNINATVQAGLASLQTYAASIIQNALGIFTSLLNWLANLFFVLIIGFILTLDGPRLRRALVIRIPQKYHDEIRFFSASVDHTFGGFLRGQLIQSALVAIGTALAMTLFGLNFVLVASLFVFLFMVIPLIGPFLALLPPLLVVLIQSPDVTLILILILFIYQFVVVNVFMPRVLSDSLGLHPLMVFFAILVSVRVAGFWGAFFGIPVAGVLWAMGRFFFERWQEQQRTNGNSSAKSDMD